ncbi:MAG: V-type ATP synthase subunit A, partial [Acutalibacteraceae bacterium]|nr:V-type ATP synthase subunit A [Acutalibacteraceae bacterium]
IGSYSEYFTDLDPWFVENYGEEFIKCRNSISSLLQEESSLMEIVKLIGADVLPDDQKLVIEIAKVIRVGYLQQNAFHSDDTYVSIEKQLLMMKTILHLYNRSKHLVSANIPINRVIEQGLFDKLLKMKYDIPNKKLEMFDDYINEIDEKISAIAAMQG